MPTTICAGQWLKDEIVDFMRTRQKPVAGALEELEAFARKENIPIIPHETVAYFRLLLQALQPKENSGNWDSNWIFSALNGRKCSRCTNYHY